MVLQLKNIIAANVEKVDKTDTYVKEDISKDLKIKYWKLKRNVLAKKNLEVPTATTAYLCCISALEDSAGAGRTPDCKYKNVLFKSQTL